VHAPLDPEKPEISLLVLETERLVLRKLSTGDAEFILELLNDDSFLRYVGDKGVRDIAGAINYIQTGPMASADC
jgi:ribosomal-protein-alanine N-acetyltransferase